MVFPSRLTFWRVVLAVSAILAFLSFWQMLGVAQSLGITVQFSKTWLALLGGLAFLGVIGLLGTALTVVPGWKAWFERFDPLSRVNDRLHWVAGVLLIVFLLAYPATMAHPYYGSLIGKEEAVRLLLFWLFGLWGAGMLRVLWKKADWPAAFGVVLLLQAVIHLVATYLAGISDYPFALGWSETSRFYYPALFLSENIFGQRYPWPILHPSLHLALVPPYLFDAPLWFHRAWQIGLRFLLVGLIAPALLSRLKLETRSLRWVAGVWIFLYLFDLPLYLHLAVPVFVMLWGFSARDDRRTWIALVLASIWAGLSRLNWYFVPGMLAAVLYLLECPLSWREKVGVREGLRYLLKPALWVLAGSAIAFISMRLYIAFSGILNAGNFFTSLTSSLLWYRLWPNASYDLGVLLGITLFSIPLWLVLGAVFARREFHPLRIGLILLGLAVLFVGGIFVSMKIGGGADIHNMDAYAVALLIVGAYLFFGRYTPEPDAKASALNFHWVFLALLMLVPVWFGQRPSIGFVTYDKAATLATLTALQQRVDSVNASGGKILFITQRHLISMGMLKDVTLIPEYEREELMEMAMADNQAYLDQFKSEVQQRRFAAIVVDPLTINLLGSDYAMGEENNAWVRYVAKPVLCNYRLVQIFPADHIAIYVPQDGSPACP
jgi:hypothetical protein